MFLSCTWSSSAGSSSIRGARVQICTSFRRDSTRAPQISYTIEIFLCRSVAAMNSVGGILGSRESGFGSYSNRMASWGWCFCG